MTSPISLEGELRLGPLQPGQQDEVRALVISHDEDIAATILRKMQPITNPAIRYLHAENTAEALHIIAQSAPQVILLQVHQSLPSTMYQLSKIWNADPSVAVLAFVEPIMWNHAEMLKEPGLDMINLQTTEYVELEWAVRHANEWTRRRRLETHLTCRDRLAIAGQLAAGIVHDINNPLMAAKTNLDLVFESLYAESTVATAELEKIRESVADARTGVQLAQQIARDLTDFSRAPEDRHEPVDLPKVLQASITLCGPQIRKNAQLVRQLDPVSHVLADSSRLCQVFVNLLINAAHAVAEGTPNENQIVVAAREESGHVVVEIQDTGCGIPKDKLEKIFEPYFTTKPVGEGTGLGMYLSRSYITLIGGEMEVESVVGEGTCIRIRLRAFEGGASVTPIPKEPVRPPEIQTSQSRILVVDDEALIRRAFVRALGKGHRIVTADGGPEALEILGAEEPFDLIFTDIMMPGMDGMQFYGEVAQRWPSLAKRVVFMSGGNIEADGPDSLRNLSNDRVTKNLSLNELRTLVHTLEKKHRNA